MNVKIYSDIIDYVLAKQDQDRIIQDPILDKAKLEEYCAALQLCVDVFYPNDGTVTAEDPTIPYESHSIVVNLKNDDFDGDRYRGFVEILSKFDGLSFIYNENELRLVLQIWGIYHH